MITLSRGYIFRIIELSKLRLPFAAENLLGLKKLSSFNVLEFLRKLNLEPRTMRQSLEG
jgi:hypothetical protein